MPSYLDFDATKHFRDFILGKTLSAPNGPKLFTADNYTIQSTRDMANTDPSAVDTNRNTDLLQPQTSNVYKPLEYFITESFDSIPRRANLSLYPSFVTGQEYGIIGIMSNKNYDTESELMKFAAWNINTNPEGPFFARLQQNLYAATVGRVRLIDALKGNTSTAINILTGREPLIEKNEKITVAKTLPGKAIDFLQTVSGVEFPWAEIPGDYLSNPRNPVISRPVATTEFGRTFQDITGAIGSLIGIQRRPTTTRKPSDLFIEYMGAGPKSTLFDNLSYSKYAPDYTTTAMSQNTSKIFNFVDNAAQGARNILGIEAPKGKGYIGDDRGNDVRFAMNDFNDRPVRSSYYLSLLFDPIQAQLFQREKNISEGGGTGGKLTWKSSKSRNKLYSTESTTNVVTYDELKTQTYKRSQDAEQVDQSLSTNYPFREDSILGQTQLILETMPTDGGASRSHVANVIDQTSRIFREDDVMISRGSAVKYVNQFTGTESGVEYCRVWTKDRSYMNYSDTMKKTTNSRKFESSVLSTPWNLNIYPNSNGNGFFDAGSTNMAPGGFDNKSNTIKNGQGFYAKKYMFSIENLAWKTSNNPGFTYNDLPFCERGPNGGRVMWFPPYDLKVNEQNNAKWYDNVFLGRPEPVYTYQNTERSGQVSFKVIVDHPSILNLLVQNHFKNMSDEESDNYINAFFAGCVDVDFYGLIRKYTTLTPDDITAIKSYLNGNKDPNVVTQRKTLLMPTSDAIVPKNEPQTVSFNTELYFENAVPRSSGEDLYTGEKYQTLYDQYVGAQPSYMSILTRGLLKLASDLWGPEQKNDYKVLTGKDTKPTTTDLNNLTGETINKINAGFTELRSSYTKFKSDLSELKRALSGNTVQSIEMIVMSRTSSIGGDHSNLDLSYRRSYSIITDILDKIKGPSADNTLYEDVTWKEKVKPSDTEKNESGITISFDRLGYKGKEGSLTIKYVFNIGEQSPDSGNASSENKNVDCSNAKNIFSTDLKITAPQTFWCRESTVGMSYITQARDTGPTKVPLNPISQPIVGKKKLVENTDTSSGTIQTPPIDELKKIIMRTLSECYYFKKLEEESPLQFTSLKEKLRYFHPAFHSMTPEGLNARLTFLNQCVRPGDTLPIKGVSDVSDLNARNTTFGPPPILVMRIGDFYHSKIIVRDVNITFDDSVWDLNPEGIGVQPMLANVTLQIAFIGGHGLEKPVERLQNALSSNFYANTEMYDARSTATEDRSKFTKSFLGELIRNPNMAVVADPNDSVTDANKIKEGEYLGILKGSMLDYTPLVDNAFTQVQNYFNMISTTYNSIVQLYDVRLSSMMLSPTYRTIQDYTVQVTNTGTDTIQLLGEYKKGYELEILTSDFKLKMLDKIATENISTIIGFNKDMSASALVKSEQILKPYISETVGKMIDSMSQFQSLKDTILIRNKIISLLDKLNFIIENGIDGKVDKGVSTGAFLSGYTYSLLYPAYSNIVTYIKDNQSKFSDDLDSSTYIFSKNTILSTNDLSYFLSVLLKDEKSNIFTKVYGKDTTTFTPRMITDMMKRFDKFITPSPSEKNFKLKTLTRKNNVQISFNFSDTTITGAQVTQLQKVNTTSGNKTTTVLNYFR